MLRHLGEKCKHINQTNDRPQEQCQNITLTSHLTTSQFVSGFLTCSQICEKTTIEQNNHQNLEWGLRSPVNRQLCSRTEDRTQCNGKAPSLSTSLDADLGHLASEKKHHSWGNFRAKKRDSVDQQGINGLMSSANFQYSSVANNLWKSTFFIKQIRTYKH